MPVMEGSSNKKPVNDSIAMNDLDNRANLVWSCLLFSGYLKSTGEKIGGTIRELKISNNKE